MDMKGMKNGGEKQPGRVKQIMLGLGFGLFFINKSWSNLLVSIKSLQKKKSLYSMDYNKIKMIIINSIITKRKRIVL